MNPFYMQHQLISIYIADPCSIFLISYKSIYPYILCIYLIYITSSIYQLKVDAMECSQEYCTIHQYHLLGYLSVSCMLLMWKKPHCFQILANSHCIHETDMRYYAFHTFMTTSSTDHLYRNIWLSNINRVEAHNPRI